MLLAPSPKRLTKEECQKIASMSGWNIAELFGCEYSGDSSAVGHGGYFYRTQEWEKWGYAEAVEFWHDHDSPTKTRYRDPILVVQRGTINKPTNPDKMEDCWRTIGASDPEHELRTSIHAEIDAVKSHWGMEPLGTAYPDLKNFNPDTWHEWKIWRSIGDWIKELGRA